MVHCQQTKVNQILELKVTALPLFLSSHMFKSQAQMLHDCFLFLFFLFTSVSADKWCASTIRLLVSLVSEEKPRKINCLKITCVLIHQSFMEGTNKLLLSLSKMFPLEIFKCLISSSILSDIYIPDCITCNQVKFI